MERRTSRRTVLRTLGLVGVGVAGCLDQRSPITPGAPTTPTPDVTEEPVDRPNRVGLIPVATGLQSPVAVAFLPDTPSCYIVDQPGQVYLSTPDGLTNDPVLDIRDQVDYGGEKGALGIALHPSFDQTDRVFIRYSTPPRDGTPPEYSHTFVLAEFTASRDRTSLDRESERPILEIPQPQGNHNAGDIAFGPDGYLYIPTGDGGASNDQGQGHAQDWYEPVAGGNGQDVTTNLLGSILRIDIDSRSEAEPYGIPPDNPLVDRDGFDEHYAWGFRNPWRISFDRTGLFVADVGERRYEEVNIVESGGNYGWNIREGTHCLDSEECPNRTPGGVRGGEPLSDPIIEYAHSGGPISGVSAIGGYVYRGSTIPGLSGQYVFGDLQANGRLFVAMRPQTDGLWPIDELAIRDADAGYLQRLLSFGRDRDRELYVLGTGDHDGGLFRVTPSD